MDENKVTRTNLEIDRSLTLDVCCEPSCGITVMVEQDMKSLGRKTRCVACTMRLKMGSNTLLRSIGK